MFRSIGWYSIPVNADVSDRIAAPRVQKMNSEETCVFDNRTHACPENEHDRVQNLNPNKNNINKTNMSKTNPILSINLTPEETIDEIEGYREIIKENIDYDSLLLVHPYDQEMVEGILWDNRSGILRCLCCIRNQLSRV